MDKDLELRKCLILNDIAKIIENTKLLAISFKKNNLYIVHVIRVIIRKRIHLRIIINARLIHCDFPNGSTIVISARHAVSITADELIFDNKFFFIIICNLL